MTEAAADAHHLTEVRRRRAWTVLAWAWLAVVLALAAHQWRFWHSPQLDDDVMALLPAESRDALLAHADERILEGATRRVVVLVGGADESGALSAARAFAQSVAAADVLLPQTDAAAQAAGALDFYRPWRDRLLTGAQRERLRHEGADTLAAAALADLYAPGATGALGDWTSDPLGLWPQWWQQRLGPGLGFRDGLPVVVHDGVAWAVLSFDAKSSAFRLDGQAHLADALDGATEKARAVTPGVRVLRAGVPLHAEAAAVRAGLEVNTIGWGSLAAVVLLMWLAFRSPLPTLLVALSLLIGCAAAVSVTVLVFGKIHLLTLVFGASLVGVAEDYGIHYFACRASRAGRSAHGLMQELMPGLLLALVTSVLAYLALGLAPFPGLRQMALFSATGLVAAFATVACWVPWLDRGVRPISGFGARIAGSLAVWPRVRSRSRATWWVLALATAFTVVGLARLTIRDDLRSLQNSPAELVQQQVEIGRLLGLPSPAQFFLVSGDSAEQVLQREEALGARLDALVAAHTLGAYEAVSRWVPSQARQQADARLSAKAESAVISRVASLTGETLKRPAFASTPLQIDDWLRQPVSEPLRARWLGRVDGRWASVVMLQGIGRDTDLGLLGRQADGIEGVRWVDRTAQISALLAHYRTMMGGLLVAGFVLVGAVLWHRYRAKAWRAGLPTVLATLLTLAALGWIGEPLQLFTVLGLLLLLGMGVDYGIFLVEHEGEGASWLAVSLGAASTLLAFGLLALSATPALHGFGLTMLLGIGLVWLLSPFFRPEASGHSGT